MGKADFEFFSKDLDKIYTRLNSPQIGLYSFIHSKYFLLRLKRVPGPVLGAESGIWADSPSGRYCPSGLHPKAGPWLGFKPPPLSLQARSCPGGGAGSPKRERFRCVWPERWLPGFLS